MQCVLFYVWVKVQGQDENKGDHSHVTCLQTLCAILCMGSKFKAKMITTKGDYSHVSMCVMGSEVS